MTLGIRHALAQGLCVVAALAPAAGKADTSFRGFFSQRFDIDLGSSGGGSSRSNESDQSLRSVTDLGTIFTTRTPRTTLTFAPGVRGTLSTEDDSDGNKILPRLNTAVSRQGPRHTLNASLAFVPDFITADDFTDVGTVQRDVIQFDLSGNAGLSYRIDPINTIQFSIFARVREYSETTTDINPNASFGGSTVWSRSIDPRTTGNLTFRYVHVIPYDESTISSSPGSPRSDTSDRSQTFSLTAGFDREVSTDLQVSASVGASFVDQLGQSSGESDDQSIGFVGSFSARYDLTDDTSMSFGISQSVDPDTRGNLQNRTTLSASLTNRINAFNTIGLTARAASDSDIFGSSADSDSGERFELSPFYSVDITQDWSARLGYALRFEDGNDSEVTNRLFFSISRSLSFLP